MKRFPVVPLLGLATVYIAVSLATNVLAFEWWIPVIIVCAGFFIQALQWRSDKLREFAGRTFSHPSLGELVTNGYGMWGTKDPVNGFVPGSPVAVVLFGDKRGPSDGALIHFSRFAETPGEHWGRLLAAEDAERADYQAAWAERSDRQYRRRATETVYETLLFLDESSVGVSGRFNWQHPEDDHLVTIYVGANEEYWSSFDG